MATGQHLYGKYKKHLNFTPTTIMGIIRFLQGGMEWIAPLQVVMRLTRPLLTQHLFLRIFLLGRAIRAPTGVQLIGGYKSARAPQVTR
ncbi:hypothetical protein A2590_02610 [Candidatus Adlerbacteria bacterium RIFOXYD1_FULL_48_8]|nr:MAG: hypothetical protein A2590_02610 [Candidatus Adlerbacteria bacterium RIFOXYD1_FULL_48_8]